MFLNINFNYEINYKLRIFLGIFKLWAAHGSSSAEKAGWIQPTHPTSSSFVILFLFLSVFCPRTPFITSLAAILFVVGIGEGLFNCKTLLCFENATNVSAMPLRQLPRSMTKMKPRAKYQAFHIPRHAGKTLMYHVTQLPCSNWVTAFHFPRNIFVHYSNWHVCARNDIWLVLNKWVISRVLKFCCFSVLLFG